MLEQLHFLRAEWFYLLIPSVILTFLLWRQSVSRNNWKKVCDAHLLTHLTVGNKQKRSHIPYIIMLIVWFIAISSIAGPSWTRLPQPVVQKSNPQVILINLSESMNTTDISPSRLARAKFKLIDILRQSAETQTGLIAFTSQPFLVSPVTEDNKTIVSMINELSSSIMPVLGNNLKPALIMAEKLLKHSGKSHGNILILTDSPASIEDIDYAMKLQKDGISISVLGIGTNAGAPTKTSTGDFLKGPDGKIIMTKFNPQTLKYLADAGGGKYIRFSQNDYDIKQILKFEKSDLKAENTVSTQNIPLWEDQGYLLLPFLLLLALVGSRRGYV